MKILTAKQIREADAYTITNEPILSIDLMERAAKECFKWIVDNISIQKSITLFCGVGNNGGDGLAIARFLHEKGYSIEIYEVAFSANPSEDYLENKSRIQELKIPIKVVSIAKEIPLISEDAVVIDAIFGTGLSRTVNRFLARLFYIINQSKAQVISIDMPSGLFSENNEKNDLDKVVNADYTLTFESAKLAYFLPETHRFFGILNILKIGLHPQFLATIKTGMYITSSTKISSIYKKRPRFVHKGDMGKTLLVAGSFGKIGACVLAAKACKRAGVGLLMVHVPKCGYSILQTSIPEAMVLVDRHENYFSEGLDTSNYTVVSVGPGLGIKKSTKKALTFLIKQTDIPMVLDADALNILSQDPQLFKEVPKNSIITPHRGEWERISGVPANDSYAQLEAAKKFAQKYKITIVLKDAITAIISEKGEVFFNQTGNSGLATGGSGDVLTGIITALKAQNYPTLDAAILGVYLHGKAADIAITQSESPESLIASDVVKYLGSAFNAVMDR